MDDAGGGEGVDADPVAEDGTVGEEVGLLEEIGQGEGQGEAEYGTKDGAAGQVGVAPVGVPGRRGVGGRGLRGGGLAPGTGGARGRGAPGRSGTGQLAHPG